MRTRKITAFLTLGFAALAIPAEAAERARTVRQALKLESGGRVYDVAVFRPNDDARHPAVVYLHGGGFSFEDPLMVRFNTALAERGLVVLAPHYLLNRTGWPHWHQTATDTVTLALSLPSVDPDRIGMSGISMGGQIALSTSARDPRVKAVAEFFTSWPGTLPDEPIANLPPVLLLNGSEDPIIPLDWAFMLDGILKERHMPFERKLYEGVGHGFGNGSAFNDALARTTAFFGGTNGVDGPAPIAEPAHPGAPAAGEPGSSGLISGFANEDPILEWSTAATSPRLAAVPSKRKKRRLAVAPPSKIDRP